MNPIIKYPQLFVGGKFYGRRPNRDDLWRIVAYYASIQTFHIERVEGPHHKVSISPSDVEVVARPIEDLSVLEAEYLINHVLIMDQVDRAVKDIHLSKGYDRIDLVDYLKVYWRSNVDSQLRVVEGRPMWKAMNIDTTRYLLSRGVYPFDQDDFAKYNLNTYYEH